MPNVNFTETLTLQRISYYKNALNFKHSEILDGMLGMFIIFSTEKWNETELYDNWNFPSP